MEALRIATERYRALCNITERYRSVTGCCRALRNITEHCGMLQHVTEASRIVTARYGKVTELLCNVTESLRKISILPITD